MTLAVGLVTALVIGGVGIYLAVLLRKVIVGALSTTAAVIAIVTAAWPHKDVVTSFIGDFVGNQSDTVEQVQQQAEKGKQDACELGATIGLECE
jgi:hypothetical protein